MGKKEVGFQFNVERSINSGKCVVDEALAKASDWVGRLQYCTIHTTFFFTANPIGKKNILKVSRKNINRFMEILLRISHSFPCFRGQHLAQYQLLNSSQNLKESPFFPE